MATSQGIRASQGTFSSLHSKAKKIKDRKDPWYVHDTYHHESHVHPIGIEL